MCYSTSTIVMLVHNQLLLCLCIPLFKKDHVRFVLSLADWIWKFWFVFRNFDSFFLNFLAKGFTDRNDNFSEKRTLLAGYAHYSNMGCGVFRQGGGVGYKIRNMLLRNKTKHWWFVVCKLCLLKRKENISRMCQSKN